MLHTSIFCRSVLLLSFFAPVSCSTFESDSWKISIPEIGLTSSPRPVDLTGDGILDLVVGAGGREFVATDFGILAIDGSNGDLLWKVGTWNQVVSSPVFKDITDDGIPDVFIGGRSAIFMAIDGADGGIIWSYLDYDPGMDLINDTTLLNFYTPQFATDVDEDGYEDLLVSFGGFFKAGTGDPNRPSGELMIVSTRTGEVLRRVSVPDGKETYMSPILHDFDSSGNPDIIIGTGGESLPGSLFRVKYADLLEEKLSDTVILAKGESTGFIAPPVLTDINLDGTLDIIANSVNGRMISIDGKTNEVIWEVSLGKGFGVYTMPAPGNFNGDDVPDFIGSFGKGVWPDSEFIAHIIVDGKDGEIIFSDSVGAFQYASPIVYDLTKNGIDDIILVNNIATKVTEGMDLVLYHNELLLLDVQKKELNVLLGPFEGSNLGSTPLLTDLDHDGYLDLIYGYMENAGSFYSFERTRIERKELRVVKQDSITWGTYMGQDYDGIFKPSN